MTRRFLLSLLPASALTHSSQLPLSRTIHLGPHTIDPCAELPPVGYIHGPGKNGKRFRVTAIDELARSFTITEYHL